VSSRCKIGIRWRGPCGPSYCPPWRLGNAAQFANHLAAGNLRAVKHYAVPPQPPHRPPDTSAVVAMNNWGWDTKSVSGRFDHYVSWNRPPRGCRTRMFPQLSVTGVPIWLERNCTQSFSLALTRRQLRRIPTSQRGAFLAKSVAAIRKSRGVKLQA